MELHDVETSEGESELDAENGEDGKVRCCAIRPSGRRCRAFVYSEHASRETCFRGIEEGPEMLGWYVGDGAKREFASDKAALRPGQGVRPPED